VGEEIYVFGGDASQEINELWIFNTSTGSSSSPFGQPSHHWLLLTVWAGV
jgi:hypothetical protein